MQGGDNTEFHTSWTAKDSEALEKEDAQMLNCGGAQIRTPLIAA
jgi:hypothetical protein